jgi:2-hydroxycyclohexanecarboxyl-CoA dehydrogenase
MGLRLMPLNRVTVKGRRALVTGAAGGMGAAICRDLAALGAEIVACDINEDGAAAVAAEVGGQAESVDLEDASSVASLTERVLRTGPVDVFVSNAGWDKVEPFLESSPAVWDKLIAINMRAPIQLTHALLPHMVDMSWGRLVFVSSDAARVGSSGEAVYAACKAALLGFAKTIAREAARAGVTSNVVCPGPTDTPLLRGISDSNPRLVESLQRAIPVGRLGQPTDVSGIVAFLCSERAEFVTGQTISVSGGLTMA